MTMRVYAGAIRAQDFHASDIWQVNGKLTFQMRVQMADDIFWQHPHKRQLVPSAQSWQLEGAKAHKGG